VMVDWFQSWRAPWWFGYSRAHRENIDAFLVAAHSSSLMARVRALPRVLRLVFAPARKV